jgi:hypothetical protein
MIIAVCVAGLLAVIGLLAFVVRLHRKTAPITRSTTRLRANGGFYWESPNWLGCGVCHGQRCRRCAAERARRRWQR